MVTVMMRDMIEMGSTMIKDKNKCKVHAPLTTTWVGQIPIVYNCFRNTTGAQKLAASFTSKTASTNGIRKNQILETIALVDPSASFPSTASTSNC